MASVQTVIGLDVGTVRTGIAIGNTIAKMARPLTTLASQEFTAQFAALVAQEKPDVLVVGLPRNLQGDATQQTAFVEDFVRTELDGYQVVMQDEAVTSQKAEAELQERGKPYGKGDIDALAASYILQDYLDNLPVSQEVSV